MADIFFVTLLEVIKNRVHKIHEIDNAQLLNFKNNKTFYELWRENVRKGVTLTAIFKLTQNVQTVMQTHTKVDNFTNFVLK